LQDKAVDEPHLGHALTAASVYGHALLLALSNPYRFSQRDQIELAIHGPDLGSHLVTRERRASEDDLAVSPGEDRGPGYLASEREEDDTARLWLDLAPLRALIEQALGG